MTDIRQLINDIDLNNPGEVGKACEELAKNPSYDNINALICITSSTPHPKSFKYGLISIGQALFKADTLSEGQKIELAKHAQRLCAEYMQSTSRTFAEVAFPVAPDPQINLSLERAMGHIDHAAKDRGNSMQEAYRSLRLAQASLNNMNKLCNGLS